MYDIRYKNNIGSRRNIKIYCDIFIKILEWK